MTPEKFIKDMAIMVYCEHLQENKKTDNITIARYSEVSAGPQSRRLTSIFEKFTPCRSLGSVFRLQSYKIKFK